MREIAADRSGIRAERNGFEAEARKCLEIRHEHIIVSRSCAFIIQIERIGVLHQEFAPAHDPETRPDLIAEFPLDMIEIERQVLVAFDMRAENIRHLLLDRKSTRLNSSHVKNSYAVFCL